MFVKNNTTNFDLFLFSFNSEELTTINHSFKQENLQNYKIRRLILIVMAVLF